MEPSTNPGSFTPRSARVIDIHGVAGICKSVDESEEKVEVEVNNTRVFIHQSMLEKENGDFRLGMAFEDLAETLQAEQIVLPVVEEVINTGKRTVDTGSGLNIKTSVTEHEQAISVPLSADELTVEHMPKGIFLEDEEECRIREVNGVVIVPVIEEVVLIEKRRRLVEEVHITRRATQRVHEETVTLKKQDVKVSRFNDVAMKEGTKR